VLIIKKYLLTNLLRKFGHIRPSSRVLEAFAEHIHPQPEHVRASPFPQVNWAYPSSEPGSSKVYRTCPAPGPDMPALAQSS
jgi:hypothetical protein